MVGRQPECVWLPTWQAWVCSTAAQRRLHISLVLRITGVDPGGIRRARLADMWEGEFDDVRRDQVNVTHRGGC